MEEKGFKNQMIPSYKCLERDSLHDCRLGMTLEINNKIYTVILTHKRGVVLLDKKLKVKKIGWKTWNNLQKKNTNQYFNWSEKTREIIQNEYSILKEKYKIEKEKRKPAIKRNPVIKRTPILRRIK